MNWMTTFNLYLQLAMNFGQVFIFSGLIKDVKLAVKVVVMIFETTYLIVLTTIVTQVYEWVTILTIIWWQKEKSLG
jgi:hypothetical protein